MELLEELELHHVGCAVKSIENSLVTYRDILGFKNISQVFHLIDISVDICFVEISPGFFIELIEPIGEKSIVNNYIKKGISYYHLGFKVKNIEATIENLLNQEFREVASVHSPAFDNRLCVFLYSPELHLVEIIDSD